MEWLGTFNRDALTHAATNTMGAIKVVFRPSAVDAELRGLLTAFQPLEQIQPHRELPGPDRPSPSSGVVESRDSVLPLRVAPATRRLTPAQLDI